MKYTHPDRYEGVFIDTEFRQIIQRKKVEKYCLACDLFMGQDHDFSECIIHDKWEDGKIVKKKNCPFSPLVITVEEHKEEYKKWSEKFEKENS